MALFPITEPVRNALHALVRNGGTATHDQCRSLARKSLFEKRLQSLFEYNLAVDTGASMSDADPAGSRIYRIPPAGVLAYLTGFHETSWKDTPPAGSPTYAAIEQEMAAVASLVGKMKRTPSWPVRSSNSTPPTSGGGSSAEATARGRSSPTRTAGGPSRSGTRTTTRSGSTSGSRRK